MKKRRPRSKILTKRSLAARLRRYRNRGKKIVFTNGCFDILHFGHVKLLSDASLLGDILVVGVNSDASVRRLKGKSRPIRTERERSMILAALEPVDYVAVFTEDTPERLIKAVAPDVLVKGGDWKKSRIVGAQFVESRGGIVRSIPLAKGYSTSSFIEKMKRIRG